MIKNNFTETGQYLSNKKKVFLEKKERPIKNYLEIINA
jgi:excinuclease UvrABC ATPase subunit